MEIGANFHTSHLVSSRTPALTHLGASSVPSNTFPIHYHLTSQSFRLQHFNPSSPGRMAQAYVLQLTIGYKNANQNTCRKPD